MSRNIEMTAYILIITFYITPKVESKFDFKVYQPQSRTVNPDGSVTIPCQHDANVSSIQDVRLNAIPLSDKSKNTRVCQRGQKNCENVTMLLENPNKCIFIILNIGDKARNMEYECEFIVKNKDIDYSRKGTPTRLVLDIKTVSHSETPCPHCPTPLHPNLLITWILVGLLVLTVLYSCVISTVCIIQKRRTAEPDNSTYVEMKTASSRRNPAFDIYCG